MGWKYCKRGMALCAGGCVEDYHKQHNVCRPKGHKPFTRLGERQKDKGGAITSGFYVFSLEKNEKTSSS